MYFHNAIRKYKIRIKHQILLTMKNLKKISRESLKSVKGGITPECAQWWGSGQPYYTSQTACLQSPGFDPENNFGCHNACGRWYVL